jgi:hypothetical protein
MHCLPGVTDVDDNSFVVAQAKLIWRQLFCGYRLVPHQLLMASILLVLTAR